MNIKRTNNNNNSKKKKKRECKNKNRMRKITKQKRTVIIFDQVSIPDDESRVSLDRRRFELD